MKLWLLSQEERASYDTYDSCVVAAETEEEAKDTTPDGFPFSQKSYANWASSPANVRCEYLGEARPDHPAGVVCASFNAG